MIELEGKRFNSDVMVTIPGSYLRFYLGHIKQPGRDGFRPPCRLGEVCRGAVPYWYERVPGRVGDASETAFADGTRSRQNTCPVTLSRTVYMTGNAANTLARRRGSGADVTLSGDRQRQQDKQCAAHLRQRHHFAIP